jgi:hypothetical protein
VISKYTGISSVDKRYIRSNLHKVFENLFGKEMDGEASLTQDELGASSLIVLN